MSSNFKFRVINVGSVILSMLLLVITVFPAFAAPPTGVPAMQANANVATVALGKVLQLEDKVKELHKLRRLGNSRNAARIARLEQEIKEVKKDNCASAQDYRLCLDKQDEVERAVVKSFNELMSGCTDEAQVSVEGVEIGKKKVCRDGQGVIHKNQGNLTMTTVRTVNGSLITTQQWSAASANVASNITQEDINSKVSWGKIGIMAAGCGVGAFGGGLGGGAIGGSLWRDRINVRLDGREEVIHGGHDAGVAIGAVAGCGAGAFLGWLATK